MSTRAQVAVSFQVCVYAVFIFSFLLCCIGGAKAQNSSADDSRYWRLLEASKNVKDICLNFNGKTLNRFCHGSFPRELKIKFKDRHIAVGTAYALWRDDNTVFVSFFPSKLFFCKTIAFNSDATLQCKRDMSGPVDYKIELPSSEMHCFEYHLDYLDLVAKTCMAQTDRFKHVDAFTRSVMHYSHRLATMKYSGTAKHDYDIKTFILTNCFVWLVIVLLRM